MMAPDSMSAIAPPARGDGKGGVGVPLALTAFQSTVSDRYLQSTIRTGRPGRVMPAFSSLSDDEVLAIVRHIRS